MSIQKRIVLALVLFAAMIWLGTAGFHYIEGWTWFDAFYMTLTTVTTVGYGEIHPLSRAGREFNSALILTALGCERVRNCDAQPGVATI